MDELKLITEEFAKLNAKIDRLNRIVTSLPTTHNTNLDEWLSEEQTKELLNKKTTSLWTLRRTGKVKFAKDGGRTYYDRQSILSYLNSNASK